MNSTATSRDVRPLISVMTPCYNEEDNVEPLYERILRAFESLPAYRFEHIFIDNASADLTVERIKNLTSKDSRVKLIVNNRNFGPIRSPMHAFVQARGVAVIALASDLQDPPELIPEFVKKWEEGAKVVVGVKPASEESWLMFRLRRAYYSLMSQISEVPVIQNFTGFGLYDRQVVEHVRQIEDPYPYFRGLIADLGFPRVEIPFLQPRRRRGITKNNFYSLYDNAMLGITSHSKLPLRIATLCGFSLSIISLLIAFGYLVAKLIFWNSFSLGTAPVVIGVFFLGAVQLFFVGVLGEYIGAINSQLRRRPWVTERERVNFDQPPDGHTKPDTDP